MDKSNGCSFSSISSIVVFSSVVFVVSLILVRLLYVLYCSSKPLSKRASKPFSTLIILGSGLHFLFLHFHPYQNISWEFHKFIVLSVVGRHIVEMLNLLAVLQKGRFNPRFYIAAATDNMSLQKAQLLENSLAAEVLFFAMSLEVPFIQWTIFFFFFSLVCVWVFWWGWGGVLKYKLGSF